MPCPLIGPFIFRNLVSHYQLVYPGQVLCVRHILLQSVAKMLCRMVFCLPGKVVVLHLDNSSAKAYLCNQGGTESPFLSRLACQILSLTDNHGITPIPAYIPTHLSVEANYLSQGWMLPEWHLLPRVAQAVLWGYNRWISWHSPIALNASIITPWNIHYLWGPWG